jgi:hypothetical protein
MVEAVARKTWICPKCNAANDKDFCGQCGTTAPELGREKNFIKLALGSVSKALLMPVVLAGLMSDVFHSSVTLGFVLLWLAGLSLDAAGNALGDGSSSRRSLTKLLSALSILILIWFGGLAAYSKAEGGLGTLILAIYPIIYWPFLFIPFFVWFLFSRGPRAIGTWLENAVTLGFALVATTYLYHRTHHLDADYPVALQDNISSLRETSIEKSPDGLSSAEQMDQIPGQPERLAVWDGGRCFVLDSKSFQWSGKLAFPMQLDFDHRIAGMQGEDYLAWAIEKVPVPGWIDPAEVAHRKARRSKFATKHKKGHKWVSSVVAPTTYAVTLSSSGGKRLWSRYFGDKIPKMVPFLWAGRPAIAIRPSEGGIKAFDLGGKPIQLKGFEPDEFFPLMGWTTVDGVSGVLWVFNQHDRLGIFDQGPQVHWLSYYYRADTWVVPWPGGLAVLNYLGGGRLDVSGVDGKALFGATLFDGNDQANRSRDGAVQSAVCQGNRLGILVRFSTSGPRTDSYPQPTATEDPTTFLRIYDGTGDLLYRHSLVQAVCLGIAGTHFVVAQRDGKFFALE